LSPQKNYLVTAPDDGLPAMAVHDWAEEKYIRSTMYAELFVTGMKNLWPYRVYVGICSGPGHVVIKETRRRILGSPLLAITSPRDQFTGYIFADKSEDYLGALEQRVQQQNPPVNATFILGDVNDKVNEIVTALDAFPSDQTLVYVFIDPFRLNIGIPVIKKIAAWGNVDVLMTLMLHHDANRAWQTYTRPGNEKIDELLADPSWRERWSEAEKTNTHPVTFLAREFDSAMQRLGYLETGEARMHMIRHSANRSPLYHLSFFSRHPRGLEFWDKVLAYSTDQWSLPL